MLAQAIIWDLDGTIADTEALHFRAWHEVMAQHGIDYPYESFIASFGRNNAEVLWELLDNPSPDSIMAISDEKERAFRALVAPESVALLPGVGEWLSYFQSRAICQLIGSSGPMANIAAVVTALGVADHFQALLSGRDLPRGKPDPALFLRCAAVAEAAPAACLVIEDSVHGIEAARRAGMVSIAVGKLAASERIRPYVEQSMEPRCVAVRYLSELHPTQLAAQLP